MEEFSVLTKVLLTLLTTAFAGWAGVVWKATRTLAEKSDEIRKDISKFSREIEHRITKVETENRMILKAIEELKDAQTKV